jgi:NDP-hexose-3-ketoreductase
MRQPKSQPLRIGILSTASIARRSVMPAMLDLPKHFRVIGVASRNMDKATEFGTQFGINSFGSYEEIISADIIDALYIPLPNSLHFYWIKYALLKGIHVLVEKSLACSLSEVHELTNIARVNGLVLVENFQFRFHNQLNAIREIIQNELGELRCMRASFGFPPFQDADNIRYKDELGGGALLDAGAYTTKISQLLLGEGLEVTSAVLNHAKHHSVDIWGGAFLQHPNSGIFSNIAFGFDNYYQCGIELWGSKGRLLTNRLFTAPAGFEVELIHETGARSKVIKVKPDNHFINMLIHFHGLILSKGDIETEHSQNIDQARMLNDIKLKSNER